MGEITVITVLYLFENNQTATRQICNYFGRNGSPISFSMACAKINSADSAPRAYISDSPLDKATVPVLDIHSSREIDQRNTECKMCSSSSLGPRPSQRLNIP